MDPALHLSDEEIALLTDEELRDYVAYLEAEKRDDGGEWVPQPKQATASELAGEAVETLFGGAAGGGKTEWLIHYALGQMLAHPWNRGAIFRRVFPSLERTIIPRCKAVYPQHGGEWNGQKHTWTFPNGSVLELASLQYEDSVLDHQGAEYGFVGFEEVTEFLESQVTYIIGRLRAPGPGIRPHLVATANPGGKGHRWVKRRWVKPKPGDTWDGEVPAPFEVWWPRPTDDDPNPPPRVFVPATLADNPLLMKRDPGYIDRLRRISDPKLRLAMEKGDWDAIDSVEGALWRQSWLDEGRVDPRWLRQLGVWERVVSVDPSDGGSKRESEATASDGKRAGGDAYGVAVCSRGADGLGYVEHTAGWRGTPGMLARRTVQLAREVAADAIVIERNHGGKWVAEAIYQADPYANVVEVWASDGKITRARPVAALFEPNPARPPGMEIAARMVGRQEEVEDQMTTYTGAPGEVSPNELDAVVHGLTHLLLGNRVADEDTYRDERLAGRR